MGPIVARLRDFIWANPRRARMAVIAAVLVAVAAVGAFAGLRPGGGSDGRMRHRQFSGALDATGETGPGAEDASTVPEAAGATNGAGGTAGAPAKGAPGTTASGPGSATGDSTSTSLGSAPGAIDAPGTGPSTATSAPGSGRGTTPSTPPAVHPGWGLLPKAPIEGRAAHTAIWTGREMVLWGGSPDFETDPSTDGAAFDPATRTWRMVPAAPLSPRFDARAFWTGREMVIYGGTSIEGVILGDGAAWDPATNRWRALPASPFGQRDGSVVAWAGDRLVVWGGSIVLPEDAPEDAEKVRNDGAAYVPATDTWVPVPAAPIVPRTGADSVWTGSRLVVTGGYHEGDDDDRVDGAAFDPVSGDWAPIADRPTPGSCGGGAACEGVWTGKVALFPVSGVAYDPAANRWSTMAPVPTRDGPAPGEPVVWTGQRLISWGINAEDETDDSGDSTDAYTGSDEPPPVRGGSYDPVADRWQTFPAGPLSTRAIHTVVWTGQEMLVWGGTGGQTALGDGAAYRPE
ncbi:MAG TPA: hypothetical protein VFF24_11130 [Acidimicrobiia bacterium]|nr:hypothetical protein [Acidimicrobiia bacterium]